MANASDQRATREAEWFDTFFDLVFAVAMSFWAERVSRDPRPLAYLLSLGWLLPIFWVWLGQTVYAMRFGESTLREQALSLMHVIGAGMMSVALLNKSTPSRAFAAGYVVARLGLLMMYAGARKTSAKARRIGNHYLVGFGCGVGLWIASLFTSKAAMPWLWMVGIAVDFTIPWLRRGLLGEMPLDRERLPVRVGIFISLLLGVSMEGIVRGLAEQGWNVKAVGLASLSLALLVCLWWIYAARINRSSLEIEVGAAQAYLYSHLPILLGSATVSIGIRVVQSDAEPEVAANGVLLVGTGILLWVLGMVLIRQVVLKHRDRYWYGPFLGALVVVPIIAVLGERHPQVTLATLVALVIALTVTERRHGRAHAAGTHRV